MTEKKRTASHGKSTASKRTSGVKKSIVSAKKSAKINRKKKERGMNAGQIAAIGIGTAIAVYFMLGVFFNTHFFPRTEINGYACGFKSVDKVKEMISDGCEEFELLLKEREGEEETIDSDQVGLTFVNDSKIDDLKEGQVGWKWITALFHKPVYENAATISYDENALNKVVDELNCTQKENMQVPKAAYPAYVKEIQKFEIVKEVPGTKIDKEKLTAKIADCLLSDQKTLDLDKNGCYVEPKFYSTDAAVIEAKDTMNRYLETELTYDFGFTKVTVEKDDISEMLSVDSNCQVTVDESKAGDYVVKIATRYNTCGIPREFTTPKGNTITISGGTYGWRIHQQEETAKLCEDIQTGETITREPIYRQTGYARDKNGDDLHGTYIAISLSLQTMWYYKNGTCLLETPVVTGNISKKMGTPTGVYEIALKQRDHVLRGEDYESPVDYWMPFYQYRGIGIHDASWRAEDAFGGEIYLTNGSHGCVNTPYKAVKELYEMVSVGTPVVVYELESELEELKKAEEEAEKEQENNTDNKKNKETKKKTN